MRRASFLLGAALAAVPVTVDHAFAIESVRLITGVSQPLFVTAPVGDPRIFVVEKPGYIEIFDQSGTPVAQFLDIDSRVNATPEGGLLCLAFPDDYDASGRFYVNYTNNSGTTTISRFSVNPGDPNDALEGSEEVLLTISQPGENHNGGRIAFSPIDGYLYIGMGDGGGPWGVDHGQSLDTLLGAILRIDVSGATGYTVPPSNPFVGVSNALDEIWAYGVRNPWGLDFDPATGDLYLADVGAASWEELNVQEAASVGGENYGWRITVGLHCYFPAEGCNMSGLTLPLHEYAHSGGNCSVTGGAVYRGAIAEISGLYFFGDWCSGRIWTFRYDGAGGITDLTDRTSELVPDVGSISTINGISRDGLGEMYICDPGGGVFKIVGDVVDAPSTPSPAVQPLAVSPNPFRSTARFELNLENAADAIVTVYDVNGAIVRRWDRGQATATMTWNGTDNAGTALPQGVYFVQVEIGDQTSRSRVTLVN